MAQTGKSSDRCSGSAVSKNTLIYKKEWIFFFIENSDEPMVKNWALLVNLIFLILIKKNDSDSLTICQN